MAQWYCRTLGEELGPMSFQQLVSMVREGTLADEDMVRAEYDRRWRRADETIGLFEMARRAPIDADVIVKTQSIAEVTDQITSPSLPESTLTLTEALLLRLPIRGGTSFDTACDGEATIEHDPAANPDEQFSNLDCDGRTPNSSHSSVGEWSDVIAAAMDAADRRDSQLAGYRKPGWGQWSQKLATVVGTAGGREEFLRATFVVAMVMIGCNGVAYGLLTWSDTESQRFPSQRLAVAGPIFPVVGRCSTTEYWLLFGHTVGLSGLGCFFASRWFAERAE